MTLLVVTPRPAWSCSCIGSDLKLRFRQADLVFTGRVLTIDRTAADVVARVETVVAYKGEVHRIEDVHTQRQVAQCGVEFVAGMRYTIFGRARGDVLRADACDGTSDATDVVARSGLAHPIPVSDGARVGGRTAAPRNERAFAVIVAAVLLLAACLGLVGRWVHGKRSAAGG